MSLFDELAASQDAALLPDLYTYNTLMAVFSHSGMLERGLELLEGLKRRGLRPDVVTYRLGTASAPVLSFPVLMRFGMLECMRMAAHHAGVIVSCWYSCFGLVRICAHNTSFNEAKL